ncbi:hypothetical protein M0534_05885 [Methylonatrum kenyense]|uniref:hypothetical protein n=1 Tax=Methylonatrum kenyense TaxID=455253 RepID=UPI0020BDEA96|nr:hypothetical protein [Methylonatrum kenyense]MCK8515854.1 hypothetical protein [Methylonatrum kenyense]
MPYDYRDNYHRELARRNDLRAAVNTPVGILALMGSLLAFMFQNYRLGLDLGSAFFGLLSLASGLAIGVGAFFLARAIHGHTYKHIECAMRLREYHQALGNWHTKYGDGKAAADKDFDDYLEQSYARAGDHNAQLNEARSADLFRAHRAMIFAAVFAGAAFLPFAYASHYQEQAPVLVHIAETTQSKHLEEDE